MSKYGDSSAIRTIGVSFCAYVEKLVTMLANVVIHRLGETIKTDMLMAVFAARADVRADVDNMCNAVVIILC
jgi:hypothetical protein